MRKAISIKRQNNLIYLNKVEKILILLLYVNIKIKIN